MGVDGQSFYPVVEMSNIGGHRVMVRRSKFTRNLQSMFFNVESEVPECCCQGRWWKQIVMF